MVAFDDDDIDVANALVDVLRGMAEIGQPGEATAGGKQVGLVSVGEREADGFLGVVGDVKAFDFEVLENEAGAGFEDLPGDFVVELGLDGAGGGGVGEDLDVGEFFQAVDAGDVVAVFVGDEDGFDLGEVFAGVEEELAEFALGETGVDEHACLPGEQHGAIARAAAAEDFETHRHVCNR